MQKSKKKNIEIDEEDEIEDSDEDESDEEEVITKPKYKEKESIDTEELKRKIKQEVLNEIKAERQQRQLQKAREELEARRQQNDIELAQERQRQIDAVKQEEVKKQVDLEKYKELIEMQESRRKAPEFKDFVNKTFDEEYQTNIKNKKNWLKLPFNSNKTKKNKAAVIYLRNDGGMDCFYKEIKDGMFKINGKTYHETDCYYTYGTRRIPVCIIPEWSLIPISKEKYGEFFAADAQEAQQLIIKAVENAEIVRLQEGEKKKMDPKFVIIGIVIIIALAYIWQTYGSKLTGG